MDIPELEEELGLKLSPLAWLPNFFSLPPQAQIASTQAYQLGKVIARVVCLCVCVSVCLSLFSFFFSFSSLLLALFYCLFSPCQNYGHLQ